MLASLAFVYTWQALSKHMVSNFYPDFEFNSCLEERCD